MPLKVRVDRVLVDAEVFINPRHSTSPSKPPVLASSQSERQDFRQAEEGREELISFYPVFGLV